MGKVKEESKSDDETEETDIKIKDELDKVKKEDTPMKVVFKIFRLFSSNLCLYILYKGLFKISYYIKKLV